jgi:hypothetical protein
MKAEVGLGPGLEPHIIVYPESNEEEALMRLFSSKAHTITNQIGLNTVFASSASGLKLTSAMLHCMKVPNDL